MKPRIFRAVGVAAGLVVLLVALAGTIVRGPIQFIKSSNRLRRPVSAERLETTVRTLCRDLTPRWYTPPVAQDRVAGWIETRFREHRLEVTEQRYRTMDGEYRNVIATRRGTDPERGSIIIGAHYDAYGNLPGADDNASGVAVLLELAATLPDAPPRRTQIFVAFANEEPPMFGSEDMGSAHFVRKAIEEKAKIDLMVALDLVGYFSDAPGSQTFPIPLLRLYYSSRGNFIAVVGDLATGRPIKRVKRGMRSLAKIPVVSVRAPRALPGVDWSDHYWFREHGFDAVLVTDTAMLRNPNYHRSTDLPETLDYARMAEVVQGLHGVLMDE